MHSRIPKAGENDMTLLAWLVTGTFFGAIASSIARQKGRGEIRWFLAGLFFLLLSLVVFFLPAVPRAGVTKVCPECAEVVKTAARVCRFCGREIARGQSAEVV